MNCLNKSLPLVKDLLKVIPDEIALTVLFNRLGDNATYDEVLNEYNRLNQSAVAVKPGVAELFQENPELAALGTPEQYSQYLDTIFPESKVKDIVYHGTNLKFDKFDKTKIGSNTAVKGEKPAFSFSNNKQQAEAYSSEITVGQNTIELAAAWFIENQHVFKNGDIKTGIIDIDNVFNHYKKELRDVNQMISPTNEIDPVTDKYKLVPVNDKNLKQLAEIKTKEWQQEHDTLLTAGARVMPVILDIKNPKIVDFKGEEKSVKFKEEQLSTRGDAFIAKNIDDWGKGDVIQVFEPEQIHILGSKKDVQGFKEFVSKEAPSEPMFQIEEMPSSVASPEMVARAKELLKKMGVVIQDIVEYAKGSGLKLGGVNGVADLTRRIVAVAEGKEDVAILEEMVHVASSMIEQKNPKLITELISKIDRFKIYKQVYEKYKNIYTLPNGKPDIRKIKKEAVDKLIVEVIVNNNENIEQYPELREEENQSFVRKIWNTILDWFKGMYRKSDISLFEEVGASIIAGEVEGEIGQGVYYQAVTPEQEAINKLIDDTNNRVTKVVEKEKEADPLLMDSEEASNFYQIKKSDGVVEKVKKRVTDRVKSWYRKRFGAKKFTEQEKKFNEEKRKYGVAGHADFEEIHKRYFNPDGTKREKPLDRPDKFNLPDEDMYDKLENYYVELVNSFPEGTLIRSEVIVYDEREKEAGTIDFLAIESSGKAHVLDWKFMHIMGDDVAWFKNGAFNIQLERYKEILRKNYNVKQFGMSRAIPISMKFEPKNKNKISEGYNLTGIAIGSVNPKMIKEIKLIPIASESESTGYDQLDKLIQRLNKLLEQASKEKVTDEQSREFKIEKLNALRLAIKKAQVTYDLSPLITVIEQMEREGDAIVNDYNTTYKDVPATTSDFKNRNLSDFSNKMNEFIKSSEIFTNVGRDLADIIYNEDLEKQAKTDEQKEDVKTRKELSDKLKKSSDSIYLHRRNIIDHSLAFADKHIGEKNLVFGLLSPEAVAKGIAFMFRGAPEIGLKSVEILSKLTGQAQLRGAADALEQIKELMSIRESLAKRGGNLRDFAKKVYQKTKEGSIVNKLAYQYSEEFIAAVNSNGENKSMEWIKDNVDVEEYNKEAKKEIERRQAYVNSRFYEEEDIRERDLEKIDRMFNLDNPKFNGWDNYVLKRHGLSKWFSAEYKEIVKDPDLLKLYNFIQNVNEKARDIGYIDNNISKNFLPFIRKSMAEGLFMDGNISAIAKWNENLKLNPDDVGYGQIDARTGELENSIPRYYTYDFTYKDGVNDYSDVSEDIFKNMILYIQQLEKYKYLVEVEGQLNLLKTIEKFKGHIRTNRLGDVTWENDKPQESDENEANAKVFDYFLRVMLYEQKYVIADSDIPLNLGKALNFVKGTINSAVGREVWKKNEDPSPTSLVKTMDAVNRAYQMKTLGLEFISGAVNWFGGNVQLLAQAGIYFKPENFFANQLKLSRQRFASTEEKEIFVQLVNTFMPLKDDPSYDLYKEAGMSRATRGSLGDFLFFFMRKPEILVEKSIFATLLDNTMVVDGKLVNINEFVRKKYKGRYDNSTKYKEVKPLMDKEIDELKKTKSISATRKLEDGKLVIPGLDLTNKDELYRLTNLARNISANVTGSMTKQQVNLASMSVWTNSMMIFKRWIPKLAETRFSELRRISDDFSVRLGDDDMVEGQKYDIGRLRLLGYVMSDGLFKGISNLRNMLYLTEEGLSELEKMYDEMSEKYRNRTGETLNMTKEEFIDMIRNNLRNQIRELMMLGSLMGVLLSLGFMAPDDEEDKATRNFHRYATRVVDKFVSELSFFYNPVEWKNALNGGIFPALGIAEDFGRFVNHFFRETTGIDFKPDTTFEEARKNAQPIKYLMRMFPISKVAVTYLAIFSNEFAEEFDVTIQAESTR